MARQVETLDRRDVAEPATRDLLRGVRPPVRRPGRIQGVSLECRRRRGVDDLEAPKLGKCLADALHEVLCEIRAPLLPCVGVTVVGERRHDHDALALRRK